MGALVLVRGGLEREGRPNGGLVGDAVQRAPRGGSRPLPEQPPPASAAPRVTEATAGNEELRLTRRGRVLVLALAVLLGVVVGFVGGRADASSAPPPETVTVAVERGDSLWSIATQVAAPGEDVRDVVREIQRLNDLPNAGLRAGDLLRLPVR